MKRGRGRGWLGCSAMCRDAVGLLLDECPGVVPGKGTFVCLYEARIGKMVGRG